jgi:hypothetical protein
MVNKLVRLHSEAYSDNLLTNLDNGDEDDEIDDEEYYYDDDHPGKITIKPNPTVCCLVSNITSR